MKILVTRCPKPGSGIGATRPVARGRRATIDGGTPTMETSLGKFQPQVLSILRIIAGLLFLSSGLQKWFGFSGSEPELRQYHIDLDDRHRRTDRDNRGRAGDGRPVYASRGLHNVGRDG